MQSLGLPTSGFTPAHLTEALVKLSVVIVARAVSELFTLAQDERMHFVMHRPASYVLGSLREPCGELLHNFLSVRNIGHLADW